MSDKRYLEGYDQGYIDGFNDSRYLSRPIELISISDFEYSLEALPPYNHVWKNREVESYRFGDELTEKISIFFVRIQSQAFKVYALKETTHEQLITMCRKVQRQPQAV